VGHARVFEHLQHFAHIARHPIPHDDPQLLPAKPRPVRNALHGLRIAALIAAPFWALLAYLILRFR
jgi:hypothetical protein